jgi:hypothetical protein
VLIVGLLSIWFNDPTRLATAFGLMSAGLAFALQQVITAIARAGEAILLEAATRHAVDTNAMASEAKADLQQRFGVDSIDLQPHVFYRITDNWLELTVRFIVGTHRIRQAKDAMSRHIVAELDKAGIGIASATYDIVGLPPIEVRAVPSVR